MVLTRLKKLLVLTSIFYITVSSTAIAQEVVPAGHGFFYKNVSILQKSVGVRAIGEMENRSGRDYQMVIFTVSFYDQNGRLAEVADTVLNNFDNGQVKSFRAVFTRRPPPKITRIKIQFESGIPR